MECWTEARALKPSRRGEATAVKLGKPVGSEELLCLNHVSSADDFSVECFLDFSGDDDDGVEDVLVHGGEEEDEDQEGQEIVSVSSSQEQAEDDNGFGPPCSDSTPADQLPLPVDDIAELEWVSRFVDDCSLPELSLLFPARNAKPGNQTYPQSEPEAYRSALRTKPRSKRARNGKTRWPSVSLTAGAALPSAADVISGGNQIVGKKQRKKGGESREAITFQRRCSHCGAHNTPQWRTGPLGAKTLCNACGVRYKSGRLCPEYRPAGSPTFSSAIHSNNHRRVLELRKRTQLAQSGPIDLTKGRE